MGRRNRHRKGISIHTPLAGSDRAASGLRGLQAIISIPTPLAGSDAALRKCWRSLIFQSTLPLRGATTTLRIISCRNRFQSTLPLRGATMVRNMTRKAKKFQSTLPLRGATPPAQADGPRSNHFNPHSPCGERREDVSQIRAIARFQSTLPLRGATLSNQQTMQLADIFQSTLPLRGATNAPKSANQPIYISSHTPLAGSDRRNETFLTK